MPLDLRNPNFKKCVERHEAWLGNFDPRHLAAWRKLLKKENEAALCEAGIRELLEEHGVTVEPNEKLEGETTGGPDFRCTVNGRHFYVEVTCVTLKTAAKRIGLTGKEPSHTLNPFNVDGMIEAIFGECVSKTPQCSGQDAPTLVAVGTFHSAGVQCFKKVLLEYVLTGKQQIAWDVPKVRGLEMGKPFKITELEHAAFIRPDSNEEIGFARLPISGVLICRLATDPAAFIGVLHPNPLRPFDPSLLPNVDFGQVSINQESGKLKVTWLQNQVDEDVDVEQYLRDHGHELAEWPDDEEASE